MSSFNSGPLVTPFSLSLPEQEKVIPAPKMLCQRLIQTLLTRDDSSTGPRRWASPGHKKQPKGYHFNQTPLRLGQSRKWEDWELPCYVTSFLTIVILGVGLNAKSNLTIETWAHQKALERLEHDCLLEFQLSQNEDSIRVRRFRIETVFEFPWVVSAVDIMIYG